MQKFTKERDTRMANKKGSRQLTKADRIKIEALLKAGHSKREIAAQLHVHRSTIYNELRGADTYTAIETERRKNGIARI